MLPSRTWRLVAVLPLAGVLWWVVGFLPWILEGLGPVPPTGVDGLVLSEQTHLLLPMGSAPLYHLTSGGLVGGLAGAAAMFLCRERRLVAALLSFLGLGVAVAVAVVQSLSGLDAVEHHYASDGRALTGLALVAVGASLVGWLLGAFATAGGLGLGVALATAAGAVPAWLSAVAAQLGADPVASLDAVGDAARWAGAAVLVAALVVTALRHPLVVLAWPPLLALAWTVGPVSTAAFYADGYIRPGIGDPDLADAFAGAWDVFWQAMRPDHRDLTPWVVAVIAAAAVLLGVRRVRHDRGEVRPQVQAGSTTD